MTNSTVRRLALAAIVIVDSVVSTGQTRGVAPAYAERGRQTEARQQAYHDRIARFYATLSERFRDAAPDLLPTIEAPPSVVHGYQLLPRVVADVPPPTPGTSPTVVSYSWRWSDTLITREMAALDRLEASLVRLPHDAGHVAYQRLAAGYRAVVNRSRPIDADIQYNWLWQAFIDRNRPLFDRLNAVQDALLERQAIEAALATDDEATIRKAAGKRGLDTTATPAALRNVLAARVAQVTGEIAAGTPGVTPPEFVRIERTTPGHTLVTVPLYTDIADAAFVERFRQAVETVWRARVNGEEFRVQLVIETVAPWTLYCGAENVAAGAAVGCTAPAKGQPINLDAHVARFPQGGAVLTTGAKTLQVAGRAIVVSPHDVTPHVLAHEFGHVLAFPDTYRRGYRNLGGDGYQITELEDRADIMGAPGTGPVLRRHFEEVITTSAVQALMRAGLDALYVRGEPRVAVERFREVLARNPTHYGATLQLAKALDGAEEPDRALDMWKKILEMAEAAQDAETIGTARARLGR